MSQRTMKMSKQTKALYKRYKRKMPLTRRVARVERQLKDATEVKYRHANYLGTSSALAPVILNLAPVPQGVNDTERIGNKIRIKSIQLRVYITNNLLTPSQTYRIVLFHAKKKVPLVNELFVQGSTTGWKAFRNADYTNIYNVLYDKPTVKNNIPIYDSFANVVNVQPMLKHHQIYKKCNIELNFDGALGTDNAESSLSLAIFCAEAPANALGYDVEYKIRYVDA